MSKNNTKENYFVNNIKLKAVETHSDLEIEINFSLKWSSHIAK